MGVLSFREKTTARLISLRSRVAAMAPDIGSHAADSLLRVTPLVWHVAKTTASEMSHWTQFPEVIAGRRKKLPHLVGIVAVVGDSLTALAKDHTDARPAIARRLGRTTIVVGVLPEHVLPDVQEEQDGALHFKDFEYGVSGPYPTAPALWSPSDKSIWIPPGGFGGVETRALTTVPDGFVFTRLLVRA